MPVYVDMCAVYVHMGVWLSEREELRDPLLQSLGTGVIPWKGSPQASGDSKATLALFASCMEITDLAE